MARIVIAGGHGQIALLLAQQLDARGDEPVGLIRKPEQTDDLADHGAAAELVDLEQVDVEELATTLEGADAVVFAAGGGPGSGLHRKWTVDFLGAVLLAEAATLAGIDRYVMVSAMGTDEPPTDGEVFSSYLRAKAFADEVVMATGLKWTVVRPGALTDDEPTGQVALARNVDRGEVPRADVAAVVAAVLADDATIGHVLEVVSGETDIPTAIHAAVV